ncbi:uncharacterized protein LOC135822942 isoform X1 [Sycon ciliatum]|uniref:uncharacterized protein LOC135822942 isoform X1 n=1 Tax=Sycon ciliatum TaxID=27933 RepID=UPI0031F5F0D9
MKGRCLVFVLFEVLTLGWLVFSFSLVYSRIVRADFIRWRVEQHALDHGLLKPDTAKDERNSSPSTKWLRTLIMCLAIVRKKRNAGSATIAATAATPDDPVPVARHLNSADTTAVAGADAVPVSRSNRSTNITTDLLSAAVSGHTDDLAILAIAGAALLLLAVACMVLYAVMLSTVRRGLQRRTKGILNDRVTKGIPDGRAWSSRPQQQQECHGGAECSSLIADLLMHQHHSLSTCQDEPIDAAVGRDIFSNSTSPPSFCSPTENTSIDGVGGRGSGSRPPSLFVSDMDDSTDLYPCTFDSDNGADSNEENEAEAREADTGSVSLHDESDRTLKADNAHELGSSDSPDNELQHNGVDSRVDLLFAQDTSSDEDCSTLCYSSPEDSM